MKFSPTNIIRIISSRASPANNSQERNKKETVDNLIRVYPKNKKKKTKNRANISAKGEKKIFFCAKWRRLVAPVSNARPLPFF